MGSKSKRQQTMAKRNREHAVEEKRRLKREKKQAARNAPDNGMPEQATPEEALQEQGPPAIEPIDVR